MDILLFILEVKLVYNCLKNINIAIIKIIVLFVLFGSIRRIRPLGEEMEKTIFKVTGIYLWELYV